MARKCMTSIIVAGSLLFLSACADSKPALAADFQVALDVAATIEGAYAAKPTADPRTVAELSRLLATAQAAVASWQTSNSPGDQGLANAAISALVAYEASAPKAP